MAGVAHDVEEHAAKVLGDGLYLANVLFQVSFYCELEVGVCGAGAVVRQRGELVEQIVDVGGLVLSAASSHLEHVVHNAIRAVSVAPYTFQIAVQVV